MKGKGRVCAFESKRCHRLCKAVSTRNLGFWRERRDWWSGVVPLGSPRRLPRLEPRLISQGLFLERNGIKTGMLQNTCIKRFLRTNLLSSFFEENRTSIFMRSSRLGTCKFGDLEGSSRVKRICPPSAGTSRSNRAVSLPIHEIRDPLETPDQIAGTWVHAFHFLSLWAAKMFSG